jgi:hypothetical protein
VAREQWQAVLLDWDAWAGGVVAIGAAG